MKTLLAIFMSLFYYQSIGQQITTYAGNGTAGYSGNGSAATSAQLNIPQGLNFDNSGNLLICHHVLVRKVNATTNIITTIAGSDTATSAGGGGNGGPATCAMLIEPYDIGVDAAGNYYIPDYWTITIRKVDIATGIINVYAGTTYASGSSGDGGPATAAKVGGIGSIRIDTFRKVLYMTDEWNHKVRKVDMLTGIITTFAGTGINGFSGDGGPATAAEFSRVYGLGLDMNGNVYIGDWDNKRIRKVDIVTGIVTSIAGNGTNGYGGDGGSATAAMLKKPSAICFDTCGNLYFSDEDNNCVRKITSSTGIITTIAGNTTPGFSGDGGSATAAQFNHPTGVCIDRNFNLYVGDYYNHRVRKIELGNCNGDGATVTEVSSKSVGSGMAIFPNPVIDFLNIPVDVINYRIVNMVGTIVRQGEVNNASSTIFLKNISAGIYFFEAITNDGRKQMARFVKL